jgi:hypothetical protein
MSYEEKYLKYKKKYLNLLSQIGGSNVPGLRNGALSNLPIQTNLHNAPGIIHQLDIYDLRRWDDVIDDVFARLNALDNKRRIVIRDYIVGVLRANMGTRIITVLRRNPFNSSWEEEMLTKHFFDLFNETTNETKPNFIERLLAIDRVFVPLSA